MLSFVSTILLLAVLGHASLLFYVFSKRHSRPIHFAFAGLVLSATLWILTNFLISYVFGERGTELVGRLAFSASVFLGFSYVILTWFFPEKTHPRPRRRTVVGLAAASAIMVCICLTPLVQRAVAPGPRGSLRPVFGPLHPLFMVYMLGMFAWGTANLIYSRRKTQSGHERMQVTYSLLGFVLSFIPAFVANFVLPYYTPVSDYYLLGAASPLVWIGFTFYAIFRHRLLDIGVAMRNLLIFGATTLVLCLAFLVLIGVHAYFRTAAPVGTYWIVAVLLSVLLAAVIEPLQRHVTRLVDRYLFRHRYDQQQALIAFNDGLGRTFGRFGIADFAADQVAVIFGAENSALFLPAASDGPLRLASQHGAVGDVPATLEVGHALIGFARRRQDAVLREELLYGADATTAAGREAAAVLEAANAELAATLECQGRLLGLLLLGPRREENTYTTADLKLLHALTGQTAVALDNARLYDAMVSSRRHYEAILQHMQRGVLTVDADLRIVMLNRAASMLFNVDPVAWRRRPVVDLVPEFEAPLRAVLRQGGERALEEMTVQIGEREVPLGYEVSRLPSLTGHPRGALVVFEDLTERRKLEAEVRRMDRLASAGTLAAGVAHEIKNPLVSIHTFAQLLPERGDEPEFRAEFSRVVTSEVDRINHMVQNLLHLAHPRGTRTGCVDMREVLNDAFVLLDQQFRKHNIEVRRAIRCAEAFVSGDREQLYQVLLNLFQNALDALMGRPPTRILRVSLEKGMGRLGNEPEKVVVVRVGDNGPGIQSADLAHIFDPFYTTKPSGHGLGLSICHGIIRDHGGVIRARSEVGAGTEFTVELPLFDRAGRGSDETPKADRTGGQEEPCRAC